MIEARQKQILDYLKLHNLVTVEELSDLTKVSTATIRRDLVRLDKAGLIYRVHGSVSLNRFVQQQPSTSEKVTQHHSEKSRIGVKAASLIKNGDSIVLDAGTTTLEIAKNIKAENVTVITPDLHIGLFLTTMGRCRVIITGGPVDNKSQSCIGNDCIEMLHKFCPSLIFMACNSFTLESGITAPTYDKCQVKQAMSQINAKKILTADSSKYGLSSLYKICSLDVFDSIITDTDLDEVAQKEIRSLEHTELIMV